MSRAAGAEAGLLGRGARVARVARVLLGTLAGLLLLSLSPAGAFAQNVDAERAVASYGAMQQNYYVPSAHLYRGGAQAYSYLWPFSQGLAATVALADVARSYRPAVVQLLGGLGDYWKPGTPGESPPSYGSYVTGSLGPGGVTYYDDDEWVGLQLVRIYRMTGERRLLLRAQEILRLAIYGWDLDPSHPCPGGVWWTQDPEFDTRNTVSNAPAAELGLELFELTGKRTFLAWGNRFYSWVRGCLLQPGGLYSDNVGLEGTIDPTVWIYNQGTMMGAETLLYRITHNPAYLEQAQQGAAATLQFFEAQRLEAQPSFFISIFLDNLRVFEATDSAISYRPALQEYADWAWESERDPQSGLFDFHHGPPEPLLEQASMVQIYAFLAAGPRLFLAPPHPHRARAAAR